jgi:hypothetical protein
MTTNSEHLQQAREALTGLDKQIVIRSLLDVMSAPHQTFIGHVYGTVKSTNEDNTLLTVYFSFEQNIPVTKRDQVTIDLTVIGKGGSIEPKRLAEIARYWSMGFEHWLRPEPHIATMYIHQSSQYKLVSPEDPLLLPCFERMHECIRSTTFPGIKANPLHERLGHALDKFRKSMIESLRAATSVASLMPE